MPSQAPRARAPFEAPVVEAVEVREDAVLVVEHLRLKSLRSAGLLGAAFRARSRPRSASWHCCRSAPGPMLSPPLRARRARIGRASSAPPIGAENCRSICGPGFGRLAGGEVVEQLLEALGGQVLVGSRSDLHHRRVHAGAEALDLVPGELAVGRDVHTARDGCAAGRPRSGRSAPRSMHGVVPQTWTCAFLPTGSRWNIV